MEKEKKKSKWKLERLNRFSSNDKGHVKAQEMELLIDILWELKELNQRGSE